MCKYQTLPRPTKLTLEIILPSSLKNYKFLNFKELGEDTFYPPVAICQARMILSSCTLVIYREFEEVVNWPIETKPRLNSIIQRFVSLFVGPSVTAVIVYTTSKTIH